MPQDKKTDRMSASERRVAVSLGGIFALRMLGLFMILPVFSLYADGLSGTTPILLGLAISAYGLTQAAFQIPFGLLSDRFGRKPIIVLGLLIFAAGSVIAALSESIHGVILGRALQGSGAIAAAVMALAADLTREQHRTKAMAIIGVGIGASFSLALVLGPVLGGLVGLEGLFWITALLALGGVLVVLGVVPTPIGSLVNRDAHAVPAQFKAVLGDANLLRLDVGIMVLHLILTASFVVVPLLLRDRAGLAPDTHWQVYLPVLICAVAAMAPFVIMAEKKRRIKHVFVGAIVVLAVSQLGLYHFGESLLGMVTMLFVFFTAFNLLEASLPSLVSKMAPPASKGTALGVYSSAQFFGAFLGGMLGGWVYGSWGPENVFLLCAVLALLWLLFAFGMRHPRHLSSYLLRVGPIDEAEARHLAHRLTQVRGVAEAVVIVEEGTAYLKVDDHDLAEDVLLREFSVAQA